MYEQIANFDPTPAVLLASLCVALVLVGFVRIMSALSALSGQEMREYVYYREVTGRNWFIDQDGGIVGDLGLFWQRYMREVQTQQVAA